MSNFLTPGVGQPGGPGFLPPTVTGPVNQAAGQGATSMLNRYAQLGLGGQGATPSSPGAGAGQTTASLMDIGALPSITGGIAREVQALLGQLQTSNLGNTAGANTSPGGIINTIGGIGSLFGK